jgi:UTP--glucose-1-phosphate uridylyltransferase
MIKRVRKAVFPVAGLGTRLLPATKSIPKEMITIVDRPLIQYAVDEAREAGIEELIFITGRGKSALVDYFDQAFELEATLREKGKSLDVLEPSRARVGELVTVRQQQPLGLGHAVWCAREIVGDEPFAVLLPDELMFGMPNCLAQMVEAYGRVGGNIVAALAVPDSETHKYGVIEPGASDGRLTEIRGMVEKPAPGTAPSNLMLPGRYILQPEVMRVLDAQERGAGNEIQLTDAMAKLIGTQPFHAYRFDGERYDCGSAAGFVIANIAMALQRADVGPPVEAFIASLRT